jgi:endonuclease YncB( thermonuclease family)
MLRVIIRSRYLFIIFCLLSMAFYGQNEAKAVNLKDELRLTTAKARVTQVIDGQTLVVNNTTTLNLPAIYIPWETPQNRGIYNKAAKDFLDKELKDRFVKIYQVRDQNRGQVDSMGHTQAFVERDDGFWVQEELLKNGLAFYYPTQSHSEFSDELYAAEAKAREAGIGLWADPKWAIVSDQDAKTLQDRFAIVEGRIEKIATRNNTIYLNFERDWKTDFTIALDSSRRRDFAKAGGNIMQWAGKMVQVRGWVRDYNGPYVEIFHPSQIRVLDENDESQ